ncbi:hypothetical protein GX408_11295 [bacterium]|nr:hypothetical protein [bacterium]
MVKGMSCFDEERLGRISLTNAALDPAEGEHLLACDRCRQTYLVWLALHQEMRTFTPSLLTNAVKRKARKVGDADSTTLKLMSLSGDRGITASRLAAQGEQPAGGYSVSSFSDPQKGMIGRLLYDKASHHLQFFLLTESATKASGIKVVLDQGRLVGFTDSQGFVDFGEQPSCCFEQVQIIRPHSTFDLTPHQDKLAGRPKRRELTGLRRQQKEFELDIARSEGRSRYTLFCKKPARKGKRKELEIVGITDKRVLTACIQDGRAVLEIPAGEELQKIHIY